MSTSDPPIIITGGSVSIEFDAGKLKGDKGRFSADDKKIQRVEVTGDGLSFAGDSPNGTVTVRIYYGNP